MPNLAYKTRNTLVLLGFLSTILLVGGYFTLFSYPSRIESQKAEILKLQQQMVTLDGIEKQLPLVENQIQVQQEKLSNMRKQIVSRVTPAMSYAYLNNIMKYSGSFPYDMIFKGEQQQGNYGYNLYNIRGEGSFRNIYKFVWYLEQGPHIYKIKKLNLRGVETKTPETERTKFVVPFEMEAWALFADVQDLPSIKRTLKDVRCRTVGNPFYPYVFKELPGNYNNLLETERAELRAIISDKAFIADHEGNIRVLRQGDAVYLGYCSRIDAQIGQVEFTLNKGGIVENYILKVRDEQEGTSEY